MATYYSYDDIHKIDAWQDNNITLMLTQGEGLDGETGSNTCVKRPTFQLKDERGIISIPTTGARLELAFTRRDGTTGSLGSNEITTSDGENGIVSFTVKPNLTSVVGKVKGEIRLITSNAVIKFYGVNFWVNKGVSNQDAIDSVEFDDLTKAFQELVRITPEGTAVLDTLDENGELPTNGTHPVASGVLKEYLKGHYVHSESVNDSAIDTANDQRTIYIHNVGDSVCGLVFFVGHNNYEEVTTVTQYRFCKGGKIEFRTGTVKSPVTTPNTYTWDKAYNEDWNPIGDKGVFVINEETVPESANWGDEIPYTYAGEFSDVAFWNGELWYLSAINEYGAQKTYAWERLLSLFDLEELENAINAKMDLAPLNPTAEQIAAMAGGQLYGDKIAQDEYDEALAFKLPQGFYYEGVLKFFSAHTSDSRYPRVYRSQMRPLIESIDFSPKVGSFWLYYTNDDSVQSLYVLSHNGGSGSSQYWRKLNNHINVVSSLPVSDPMPHKTNYSYDISGLEIPPYDVNDEIIVSANGQVALYKCLGYNKVYDSSLGGYKAVYNWREKSRVYTKTEIDTMIRDIETRLDQVRGVSNE